MEATVREIIELDSVAESQTHVNQKWCIKD